MQQIYDSTHSSPPQMEATLLTSATDLSAYGDWDDVGEDDQNRHARAANSLAPARPIVTGTDVSHELVFLVNEHPLLPSEPAIADRPQTVSPTDVHEEEMHQEMPEHQQNLAQLSSVTQNNAANAKGANSTPLVAEQEHNAHQKAAAHTAPATHADVASTPAHVAHPDAHAAVQAHQIDSIQAHAEAAHASSSPEIYQGISQHDSHLSALIAADSLPLAGQPVVADAPAAAPAAAAASAPGPGMLSAASAPTASELLIPAEELLFSHDASLSNDSPKALELTDLLGGEAPGSWNTHQPTMDEGVMQVMPEYTPVELEQTDLHHLF